MSAVGELKGNMPQQVRSLVSIFPRSKDSCAKLCDPRVCVVGHARLDESRDQDSGYIVCPGSTTALTFAKPSLPNAVSPVITARQAVHSLQLPRVCQATDTGRLPGKDERARSTPDSGAGTKGSEGTAGDQSTAPDLWRASTTTATRTDGHAYSVKPLSAISTSWTG